ncbi:uncharacterized protein ColSpa_10455 [Colletotrichum spaethianum]|uniref:Uncharacterized protein n=1 Tax=Colletotrichum spaethianum TaxID=700344 RepID=A0AA37PDN1_9PEZI|nr:uncharacterized protein ColSpa_10455 [Colletotrichum spaethianum]GKT50274.1 hypothetical protein ColSpa_10455 [Colletotrichum spaethianum]
MSSSKCHFLDLPLEIRLDIYAHLLLHPPIDKLNPNRPAARIHPAILTASRQTHAEGTPVLYSKNMFLAHATLLASFPRLRLWYPPVRERSVLPQIRRFHIRVRLDCDPAFDASAAAAAFSGVDELVVEVWQAMFQGADHGALQVFEGVRGVRDVKVYGSITGFEGYVRWLEDVMRYDTGGGERTSLAETRRPSPIA